MTEEEIEMDIPAWLHTVAVEWGRVSRSLTSIDDLTDEERREFAQLVAEDVFTTIAVGVTLALLKAGE